MSGMLNGIFWLIRAAYINLGSFIQCFFFAANKNDVGGLSCSFWILWYKWYSALLASLCLCLLHLSIKEENEKKNMTYI